MVQEVFRIGSFAISPFGLMMMLAFLAAYWQFGKGLQATGAGDWDDASALLLGAGFGGLVGAKVYYAALYGDWALLLDRAGLVWYGGFLLGTAVVLLLAVRRRLPARRTADAAAPALALGYAVGRIGCFLVGDDYGVPTDLPWGVAFPVGLPPTTAGALRRTFQLDLPPGLPDDRLLAVHPTQLYECLLALMICGVGWWLLRRSVKPGLTALSVIALMALERFGIEFLRAKDDRLVGSLTIAQLISLGLLGVCAVLWLRWRRSTPSSVAAGLVGER